MSHVRSTTNRLVIATTAIFIGLSSPSATAEKSKRGAPEWNKRAVQGLIGQAQRAAQAPSVQAQDSLLAETAGMAYQVARQPNESTDAFARRILRARDPNHAKVRNGQWLTALAFRFYSDVGGRARSLARFERLPRDRRTLEQIAKQCEQVAKQLAPMVQTKVAGVEGYLAPLPRASGSEPTPLGAKAYVRGQKVQVEHLDRITFVNDRPDEAAQRTSRGSLRQVYAAMAQFQRFAGLFDKHDRKNKKGSGILKVFIPAAKPARYLNELVRAAKEAQMHTLYVMTVGPKSGELRQTKLTLRAKRKKRRRKKGKSVEVFCKDDLRMQKCVDYIVGLRKSGRLRYALK